MPSYAHCRNRYHNRWRKSTEPTRLYRGTWLQVRKLGQEECFAVKILANVHLLPQSGEEVAIQDGLECRWTWQARLSAAIALNLSCQQCNRRPRKQRPQVELITHEHGIPKAHQKLESLLSMKLANYIPGNEFYAKLEEYGIYRICWPCLMRFDDRRHLRFVTTLPFEFENPDDLIGLGAQLFQ